MLNPTRFQPRPPTVASRSEYNNGFIPKTRKCRELNNNNNNNNNSNNSSSNNSNNNNSSSSNNNNNNNNNISNNNFILVSNVFITVVLCASWKHSGK